MSPNKFEVEVWSGNGDFSLWRKKMKAVLLQQRCAKAIDESWPEDLDDIKKQEMDEIAWSSIFLHLSDSVLRQDLSLDVNLDRFSKIVKDLANCSEILSEDQKVVALLNSLSEKYKDIKNALEYGRENLTVDLIFNCLRNKELEFISDKKEQAKPLVGNSLTAITTDNDKSDLWIKRLGHISDKGLKSLTNEGVFGKDKIEKLSFCEQYVIGKQNILPFKTGTHKSTSILEYLHADLWGPAPVNNFTGFKFYFLIVDNFSRKVWTFLLKSKSETFQIFKDWKTLIDNQTDKKIKVLRTDNGLEFCNFKFDSFYKVSGILRHRTTTYTLQQHGIAERMNRTILNKVKCMLHSSGLSKLFWGEAVMTTSYLIKLSPSSVLVNKSPEKLSGKVTHMITHSLKFLDVLHMHIKMVENLNQRP
ncbi:Integrase catalytic domain-containing protein [Abeliophyllum distichum]|uniref:Integrase catalytic domain-containing protein n=1 Tax=Abeliophyllum distichum TaxID=126358 RepID=A0ABD1QVE9_9LAMI